MPFTRDALADAAALIYRQMPPTPQFAWPLLGQRLGAEVWVKHENHTPTGAFKIRGGITFIDWLRRAHPEVRGIVTATRGNHGQAQARAAAAAGLTAKIYVPQGNAREKNAAMRGFGAEVVEFGADFDSAKAEAMHVAAAEGLFPVPPFHPELLRGVATYGLELLTAVPDLATIYVPIGCGSGICGTIAARDALGLKTEVVGVVSTEAAAAKLSFETGQIVETASANTFADGVAVRAPVPEAFAIYSKGAARILAVSDAEIADAVRIFFHDTHNLAEGAGAVGLAGLIQERDRQQGKRVAVILSGANMDTEMTARVLAGTL
ncbi:threonine dehydratase [Elstera sp.]|jgi:threonine dehydratase|uniref:threonine dehydratase n=1 Tax=Elstera sp. TaxID=1916664 RepID=UPI0037BFB6FD